MHALHAVADPQAIIWARNVSGASFVVTNTPIGEISNSETANIAMMPTTASAGTAFPDVLAIGKNKRNAMPMPITP